MFLAECALALIGVFIALNRPTVASRWFEKIESLCSGFASRRGIAVAAVGLSTLLLRVAVLPVEPIPHPVAHDEFGYLLQADTFAHGRLTNTTPAMWEHFETFHEIFQPTYCAKYFPAQGMFLALGKVVFGHPFWGVWLTSGLMCATITWMLQGWFSPGWALLGGFIAMLRFGVFGYWADSYWGGNVAAIGGALVLGALPRIRSTQRVRDSILMGLGLALLANSRPWEGLVLGLPVLAILIFWMFGELRSTFKGALRIVFPITLIMGITAGWITYYCWRTTGDPLRTPYQVHEETYGAVPYMLWQRPKPEPAYRYAELREFHAVFEMGIYTTYKSVLGQMLRMLKAWVFFLGPVLIQPFLFLILALASGFSLRHIQSNTRILLAIIGVFAIGTELAVFYTPHYSAPATGLLLALLLVAMRQMRNSNLAGLFLSRALPLLCVFAFAIRVFAGPLHISPSEFATYYFHEFMQQHSRNWFPRADIGAKLSRISGDHLVIVRYSPEHEVRLEWVYNDADIEHSRIVWARDMGAVDNAQLVEHFKTRKAWLLEPDTAPPRLSAYDNAPENAAQMLQVQLSH